MGWESSDVYRFDLGSLLEGQTGQPNLKVLITCFLLVRFDLGPLLQGQMRTAKPKVLIICLLLVLEVCNVKPTCRKSCAENLECGQI